jgi:hypothetical protein
MAKPPQASGLRRSKNERNLPGHADRWERRSGLWLAVSRAGQRERERERRVSDADASYYAPNRGARTPDCVIPKRNHARYNSLSKASRSLSQGPRQNCVGVDHEDRPRPDLMYAPPNSYLRCGYVATVHDLCTTVKVPFLKVCAEGPSGDSPNRRAESRARRAGPAGYAPATSRAYLPWAPELPLTGYSPVKQASQCVARVAPTAS